MSYNKQKQITKAHSVCIVEADIKQLIKNITVITAKTEREGCCELKILARGAHLLKLLQTYRLIRTSQLWRVEMLKIACQNYVCTIFTSLIAIYSPPLHLIQNPF